MQIFRVYRVDALFMGLALSLIFTVLTGIAIGAIKLFGLEETISIIWLQRLSKAFFFSLFLAIFNFIILFIRLAILWFQDKDGRYFGRR